jgi:hypothetical protein
LHLSYTNHHISTGAKKKFERSITNCWGIRKPREKKYQPPQNYNPRFRTHVWTEHNDFLTWIEDAWSADVTGSHMFRLYSRLKAVKAKLKRVNKDLYGCISQKVLIARQKLESVQMRLLQKHGEVELRNTEQIYLHEFSAIQKAEEAFMKQKARNKWLNLGDQNSRFFHCQVKVRQARNAIKCLFDAEGNRLDTPDQIKEEVISFYQKLLGVSNAENEGEMITTVSTLMDSTISDNTKVLLAKEVTEEEIKSSMFSLGSEKAPGPMDSQHAFSRKLGLLLAVMCARLSNLFFSQVLFSKKLTPLLLLWFPKFITPLLLLNSGQ